MSSPMLVMRLKPSLIGCGIQATTKSSVAPSRLRKSWSPLTRTLESLRSFIDCLTGASFALSDSPLFDCFQPSSSLCVLLRPFPTRCHSECHSTSTSALNPFFLIRCRLPQRVDHNNFVGTLCPLQFQPKLILQRIRKTLQGDNPAKLPLKVPL